MTRRGEPIGVHLIYLKTKVLEIIRTAHSLPSSPILRHYNIIFSYIYFVYIFLYHSGETYIFMIDKVYIVSSFQKVDCQGDVSINVFVIPGKCNTITLYMYVTVLTKNNE